MKWLSEEIPATITDDLSSVPRTHMMKEESRHPQLVMWPPREDSLLESFLFFHHVSLRNELRAPGWVAEVFSVYAILGISYSTSFSDQNERLLGRSVIVKRKGELNVNRPHFEGVVRDKTTL